MERVRGCLLLVLACLGPSASALAATFTLNAVDERRDAAPGDGSCDADPAAPGEQCTLRAAVQEANATPGAGGGRSASPRPSTAAARGEPAVRDGAARERRRCPRSRARQSRVTLLDAACLLISLRLGKSGAPGRTRGSGCVKGRNRQLHSR